MTNYLGNTDFLRFEDFKYKLKITEKVEKDMRDNGFDNRLQFKRFLTDECDVNWYQYLLNNMIEEGLVETLHQITDNKMYYRLI